MKNCIKKKLKEKGIYDILLFVKTKYGKIYSAKDSDYKSILIKVFNNYNEYLVIKKYYNNFKNNSFFYKILCFDDLGFITMEKINGNIITQKYPDLKDRVACITQFLKQWVNCVPIIKTIDEDIYYLTLVKKQLYKLRNKLMPKDLKALFKIYKNVVNNVQKKEINYLLHGDINISNIICYNHDNFILIDFSPIIGNLEIELLKYIEDEIFRDINNKEYILEYIISSFEVLPINKKLLLQMLFIDSCYRTFDSYIEKDKKSILQKGIIINKYLYEIL